MSIEHRTLVRDVRMSEETSGEDSIGSIEGYAALFDSRSELINLSDSGRPVFGQEVIARGAFDDVLNDDVRALVDHESSRILGRAGRNLTLTIDDVGLKYKVDLIDTTEARDLQKNIKAGLVRESSFGFSLAPQGDAWEFRGDVPLRTVTKVGRLYDVSPVAFPAYADTSVAARSLSQAVRSQSPTETPELTPERAAIDQLVRAFFESDKRFSEVYSTIHTDFGVWITGSDAEDLVADVFKAVSPAEVKDAMDNAMSGNDEEIRKRLDEFERQFGLVSQRFDAMERAVRATP